MRSILETASSKGSVASFLYAPIEIRSAFSDTTPSYSGNGEAKILGSFADYLYH